MKQNQKKVLLISSIVILILAGAFYFFSVSKKILIQKITPSQPSLVREGEKTENEVQIGAKPLSGDKNPSQPPLIREGENAQNIQFTLNVLDKTYTVNIKDGATVYDAMNIIQDAKENNFSFKAKEYPSLGIFIEEINGAKGTPGKYWIYYVNNTEASVSVSKYILKSGDIISWKQE